MRSSPCLSDDRHWIDASGRGTIDGFTVFDQPYLKSFRDDLPYNVALIKLEEGPRLYSNIVGTPNSELRSGLPVLVVFDDVTEDFTLPKFQVQES